MKFEGKICLWMRAFSFTSIYFWNKTTTRRISAVKTRKLTLFLNLYEPPVITATIQQYTLLHLHHTQSYPVWMSPSHRWPSQMYPPHRTCTTI